VRRVPGLKDVVSHIRITTGRPLDPIGLVNQVADALGQQLGLSAPRIHVEVDHDGVVSLVGEVESAEERERAEQVVLGVPGVHRVVNQIRALRR
jgi:osmotically-inducible protein OsmY